MRTILSLLFLLCLLSTCKQQKGPLANTSKSPVADTIFTVTADMETNPIQSTFGTDAADDPAIWIHPEDFSKSLIFGSNKTGGIATYNLSGSEIAYAEVGRINNIDVAYHLQLQDTTMDICGGTNRTKNAIDLFRIDPTSGQLTIILEETVPSGVDEVYGFCFYHSPSSHKNYAILCGKNGVIEQYEILEGRENLGLVLVDSFDIGSQPEGMVADHKLGYLYIGEENVRIWKVTAEPGPREPMPVAFSSVEENPNLTYDIEGLTIYYTPSDEGYLIASSQGNNSFAVYTRSGNNEYLGSFQIVDEAIDGNSDTDGIDVINLNLGPAFPNGLFIAQDGTNLDGTEKRPQNFKVVSWKKVANLFDPPLAMEPPFNTRALFEKKPAAE